MSLLEDVYLQDEAGEAQELERIIEGDEYDERPGAQSRNDDSDDNSEKEDEAEEDKRRVDPTSAKPKRVVKNPRFILNPARLTGPRGIQVLPDHFKDFKFKGKGHEKEDLDLVLKKLEHWAYRLYPKFQFEDCLKKIETLGKKKAVQVNLHKIRTDQFQSEETVVQRESSDDEAPAPDPQDDEFDRLLQQQIDLARDTPTPASLKKTGLSTPMVDRSISMPKATSSPSINEEQRLRMLKNRQLAEERRLARLKQNSVASDTIHDNSNDISKAIEENIKENGKSIADIEEEIIKEKNNKPNVIDSSDEDDAVTVNEPVIVDVHHNRKIINNDNSDDESRRRTEKNNKSNVIDSSDEDNAVTMHESDAVDVHDVVGNDTSKSREIYNKSNVVDSSDEDDAMAISESVTVDVHDSHKNVDNDNSVNNSPNCKENRNKANIIDSSEDDYDTVMNENVAIEVHNSLKNNFIDSTKKNNTVEENGLNVITSLNKQTNEEININGIESNTKSDFKKTMKSPEEFNDISKIYNHEVNHVANESANKSIDSETLLGKDATDTGNDVELADIMDVDFCDDF